MIFRKWSRVGESWWLLQSWSESGRDWWGVVISESRKSNFVGEGLDEKDEDGCNIEESLNSAYRNVWDTVIAEGTCCWYETDSDSKSLESWIFFEHTLRIVDVGRLVDVTEHSIIEDEEGNRAEDDNLEGGEPFSCYFEEYLHDCEESVGNECVEIGNVGMWLSEIDKNLHNWSKKLNYNWITISFWKLIFLKKCF